MGKAPECFHFVCTKGASSWTAAPLKGDDQPAASLEGAEADTLDALAKKLGLVVKGAKGETGRICCNVITPKKALFTSTIGGVVIASGGPAPAAAPAKGGAQPAAAAAKEPEPEPEEEEAGGFDLFD